MLPIAVYVHWPFCASKCPYCDFNSHVHETIDQSAWVRGYEKEIETMARQTPDRLVTSIFFGGGTPSLMDAKTVESVLKAISQNWTVDKNVEITLEANPNSVEANKFKAFFESGINRVSIGIQALNDNDLKFLGRKHDTKESQQALEIAARTFDRYSFDLIYARPKQTLEAWEKELDQALSFGTDHLSLYQLTIEPQTPFYTAYARGEFVMPPDDLSADFYDLTQVKLAACGLLPYEVSNYAKPGQESRHNLTYWRYGDYVGIGPGAHGRLTIKGEKRATRAHRAPDIWLKKVEEFGHGHHEPEILTPLQRASEAVLMGLRLTEGVPFERISGEAGKKWQEVIDMPRFEAAIKEGLLEVTDTEMLATKSGRLRLNHLVAHVMR